MGHESWVASIKMPLGGWCLRADNGVTRRANSVHTIHSPFPYSLKEAIRKAEEFYKELGITPQFQVSEASMPRGLDRTLQNRGYKIGLQVFVQIMEIGNFDFSDRGNAVRRLHAPNDEWFKTFFRGSGYNPNQRKIREGLMTRTTLNKMFVSGLEDERIVGVGQAIQSGKWVGLFNINIDHEYRRIGFGSSITAELLRWGIEQGAQLAYLQVSWNNEAAIAMYKELGFNTAYKYWYRDLE